MRFRNEAGDFDSFFDLFEANRHRMCRDSEISSGGVHGCAFRFPTDLAEEVFNTVRTVLKGVPAEMQKLEATSPLARLRESTHG